MRPWQDIPRRGYVTRPTPLEELARFSKKAGVRVRVKRDDLLPLGGNKIRKLDYLIEEAVQAGADTLITASTNQCCHNSMTALLAAREGMACRVIMESWGDTRYRYETAANHAMMELCGPEETAVVTDLPSGPVEDMPEARRMAEAARAAGKKPWFLSRGGSGPLGALGYVRCAEELIGQWGDDPPEAVICPCGIGGTQAGLTVGLRLLGCGIPVVGVGVTGKGREDMERSVRSQCRELTDFLETEPVPEDAVRCVEGFSGGGYGKPSREQVLWMKALAASEGILTDPAYSGKALYGLCGLAARGEYQGPGGLVFLHTGGLQLFYDFSSLADVEA